VDEYLERRSAAIAAEAQALAVETGPTATSAADAQAGRPKAGSAEERAARKTVSRIDKQLAKLAEQEAQLNAEVLEHAQDYEKLAELSARLTAIADEKDELELEWLEAAELLE
jgi:ATP-binding cassette subfamily F protein uup